MKILAHLIVAFTILVAASCNNDEEIATVEKLYGSWEAVSIISVESKNYSKKDGYNPVITFSKNGYLELKLDVNNCGGSFTATGNNIDIIGSGCTKICCDSDFSEKFAGMLSEVSAYSFDRNRYLRLQIEEWGYLKLEKVE